MFSTPGGCQSALVFFHEWQAENKVRATARRSLLRRTFLNGRVRSCERPNVPRIALLSNHTLNKGPCQQKFGGHLFSTQKNLCLLKYYFTSPQGFEEEQTCETKIKVDLSNIILTVMALWESFSFFCETAQTPQTFISLLSESDHNWPPCSNCQTHRESFDSLTVFTTVHMRVVENCFYRITYVPVENYSEKHLRCALWKSSIQDLWRTINGKRNN